MTRKLVHLDSELSAFDDSYSTCAAERTWCDNAKPSTTACREILAKLSMRFNLTIVLPRLVLYTVYAGSLSYSPRERTHECSSVAPYKPFSTLVALELIVSIVSVSLVYFGT